MRRAWTSAGAVVSYVALILCLPLSSFAQILSDVNGDGTVSIYAFGDSITRGVGDGTAVGAYVPVVPPNSGSGGYPARVSTLLSVPVVNGGKPGEVFTSEGLKRLATELSASSADIVTIFEGSNDAIFKTSSIDYAFGLQKAVNIAFATGKVPLLVTVPAPCCDHAGPAPFTSSYSSKVREIAAINDLAIADVDRAWLTSCEDPAECQFYNLPEGLHPNSTGYDAIAQTIAAALLGINIFSEEGSGEFADALELDPTSILVKPE